MKTKVLAFHLPLTALAIAIDIHPLQIRQKLHRVDLLTGN